MSADQLKSTDHQSSESAGMHMPPVADNKARFDILFETLRDYQQSLLDNSAKTAGFLLLSIGWLATSQTARDTLRSDGLLRGAAVCAVFVGMAVYITAALHVYRAARRIRARLVDLSYLPLDDLEARRLSGNMVLVFTLGNLAIALLLVAVIWRLGL